MNSKRLSKILAIALASVLLVLLSSCKIWFETENCVFTAPSEMMVEKFVDYCISEGYKLENYKFKSCDYLFISQAPHQSDSYMALVAACENEINWDNAVMYSGQTKPTRALYNNEGNREIFAYDAVSNWGPFFSVYKLADDDKVLFVMMNVPADVLDQVESAAK